MSSRWIVFEPRSPDVILATVVFEAGTTGHTGAVTIEADEEIRELILFYLDDPLDQRPVYEEGLGPQRGPHSHDERQFDRAMSTLGFYFTSFDAAPA